MKKLNAMTWIAAAAIGWAAAGVGAWGQANARKPLTPQQRKLLEQQKRQVQQMIQKSLGPAAGLAPDPTARRPMDKALFGQGAELTGAIQAAQRQAMERIQSQPAIPAAAMAAALPSEIGDCPRVELELTEPEPTGSGASLGKSLTSRVRATYRDDAGQTVRVDLIDSGVLGGALATEETEEGEAVQEAQTAETVVTVREIQGVSAKIYYDRFDEAGTLYMKANRVMVNIQGQGIPLAMLEESANALKVDALVRLGGAAR